MAIVAIISSPRKDSNTGALVNAAAEAAKENGKEVIVFNINDIKDKNGCQACNACKGSGNCIQKDGITPILNAIRDAEGLIVSSPVYFGQPTAQYRIFEDRLYGFLKAGFVPSIDAGKKLAIFTTAGSAGADKIADQMEFAFVNFLKFQCVGKMPVVTQNAPDFVAKNPDLLAKAKEIGKKL